MAFRPHEDLFQRPCNVVSHVKAWAAQTPQMGSALQEVCGMRGGGHSRPGPGEKLIPGSDGLPSGFAWTHLGGTFEKQLLNQGTVLCKFWIHISPEKQMERFKKRLEIPYKRHKITDEDWRNREKWPAYEEAIKDMIHRTDSPSAPWTLVAGNNKKFAFDVFEVCLLTFRM